MAAVFGGTQSLHTNALDEAIALPSEYSAAIARNTQLYLQKKAGLTQAIDPFGGSYYIEYLTTALLAKAEKHIEEIENLGGMTRAIETGIPKMRIEEAAALKQASIENGEARIVGVNYMKSAQENEIDTLEVDNIKVLNNQIERLRRLRESRDEAETISSLEALKECAKNGRGNLLQASVEAARKRATLEKYQRLLKK